MQQLEAEVAKDYERLKAEILRRYDIDLQAVIQGGVKKARGILL